MYILKISSFTRLISLLLLFLLPELMFPQQLAETRKPSDLHLKGNVKTVQKRSFYAIATDSGKIIKGNVYRDKHDRDDYFIAFNAKGNITECRIMDDDKMFEKWIRTYTYDSLERLHIEFSNKVLLKRYFYNSASQLILVTWPEGEYRKMRPDTKDTLIYNNTGQLIEKTRFEGIDEDRIQKITTRIGYDKNGNKISEQRYFDKRKADSRKYIYSVEGRLLQVNEKWPKEWEAPTSGYQKFDTAGNEIEYAYTYDWDVKSSGKNIKTYNDKNDLISDASYENRDLALTVKYTYEYDQQGNWTKMIVYENGKPHCIHEREITYY